VPESRDPAPGRLDVPGVLLSIAGLGALVFGIIRGGEGVGWTTPGVLGPLLAGLALLGAFVWWQRRTTHPALDVSLFRLPAFSAAAGALALNFFALQGATFYLVYYLQGALGYSPLQSGASLVPMAVAIAIASPRASRLADRFGAKLVCAAGFGLMATAFAANQLLDLEAPVWLVLAVLFLQGLGLGTVLAPATESIMSVVPREKAGAGGAVNNTVRQVGGALGVAILGSLVAGVYAARLGDAVDVLPEAAREQARQSVVATLEAVRVTGATELVQPAREAFVAAMHVTAIGTAASAAFAAVVCLVWLPGRRPQPMG